MKAVELLARLRGAGISLSVQDGKIRIRGDRNALTADLQADVAANKAELLQLLASGAGTPALTPLDRNRNFPLSYGQQRLWFLDELEPGTAIYNMPFAVEATGHLDRAALQKALDKLISRHEILRTVFVAADREPTQQILPELHIPINFEQVDSGEADIAARARAIARTGFDLACGPLLRFHVLTSGSNNHLLVIVLHHIISDLWSLELLFRELGALYAAELDVPTTKLPALPVQFADYAVWQRQLLSGDRLQQHLDFWRTQLADAPPVLELPLDFPRPAEPGYRGNWLAHQLDPALLQQLEASASAHGCTLFMLTFAAFATLLSRYSGSDDVVIGTPVSGREHAELEGLIGFFLNTLPLRINTGSNPDCRQFLAQVRSCALSAYAHQELPFEHLVEQLQPERNLSYTPVFQHMFIWQDSRSTRFHMPGLDAAPAVLISHDTAKFDLTLALSRTANGIEAGIEYNTELFGHSTIERMLRHYETLLAALLAKADTPLAALPWLGTAERNQIVDAFNATVTDFGVPQCVHEMVEQQAAATPTAIALIFKEQKLSYAELNGRANALAQELIARGAAPGKIVAISCTRSAELALAALAVLKSGACYLAVDPEYPADRVTAMLADSNALLILTQSFVQLPEHGIARINLDESSGTCADNPTSLATPADPLYCIYTSGSTGRPKGVRLSHAGLANLLCWQQQHPRLSRPALTLQFASFSFDVSFQELFSTWTTGGTVVMIEAELRQDLPLLADFITAAPIERLYLPFAALQPLAESLLAHNQAIALQDIVVAGEQLQVTTEIRQLCRRLNGGALHNQYGPSETHVVTAQTLTGDPEHWPTLPAIGRPVANTHCYVLDSRMEPQPLGVPGELYLGGVQVALGYLGRPQLNAEKFIASPFIQGDRLYRTGDRARWREDGTLDFLGRADDQFKWRGFRIEPGEIEAALAADPTVRQAAVMLREDTPGMQRLVAYITAASGCQPDNNSLRHSLRNQLPEHMVPSVIMLIDVMPLTPSGKLARRQLPIPPVGDSEAAWVEPRTPVEIALAAIWREVLQIDRIGAGDDFFALGGHSLLATKVVARIRQEFQLALPLKYLFRYPTPATLAAALETLIAATSPATSPVSSDREEFRL